jgi:hypothetical protein
VLSGRAEAVPAVPAVADDLVVAELCWDEMGASPE